jgi:cell division protein FtsB
MKDTEAEGRKQADLKDKMSKLKKNDYVRQLAREKLGYIERGESPYKVIIK